MAIVVVVIVFSSLSPYFATWANGAVIMRNCLELLLAALGMTLLLAMGGIDVSIGVGMGLAALAVGKALLAGWHPLLVVALGPLTGIILGLIVGSIVVFGRVPAIVATLGLLGIYRTAIFAFLGGQWLVGLPADLGDIFAYSIIGVPLSILLVLAAYAVVWCLLRQTPYGLHLLAIGQSEERARLTGLRVKKIRLMTFVISLSLVGLAASFYVASYRNVEMTIGATLALDAIAAVVMGGTSTLGGRCSLLGSFLGVIALRLLQNGLLLVGLPSLWQPVITGLVLIGVLSIDFFSQQGRLAWRTRRGAAL